MSLFNKKSNVKVFKGLVTCLKGSDSSWKIDAISPIRYQTIKLSKKIIPTLPNEVIRLGERPIEVQWVDKKIDYLMINGWVLIEKGAPIQKAYSTRICRHEYHGNSYDKQHMGYCRQ